MNAASAPNSTVRLITMSNSYSRYFMTASHNVASRKISDSAKMMTDVGEFVRNTGIAVMPTRAAAAANQVSWRRSAPRDLMNRTTTAATLTASASGKRSSRTPNTNGMTTCRSGWNGCDHKRVAPLTADTAVAAHMAPAHQAAGRQRGEGSVPSGNSSSARVRQHQVTTSATEYSHMAACPAG